MSDAVVPLGKDELQKMLDYSPFIAFLGLKVTEADAANELGRASSGVLAVEFGQGALD